MINSMYTGNQPINMLEMFIGKKEMWAKNKNIREIVLLGHLLLIVKYNMKFISDIWVIISLLLPSLSELNCVVYTLIGAWSKITKQETAKYNFKGLLQ